MNRFFPSFALVSLLSCGLAGLTGCAAETTDPAGASDDDITAASNGALMDLLTKANAPSDIPAGNLGVGGRIARVQLTTAQGGIAKFISEGGYVSTTDGGSLGNFFDLGGDWAAVEKAMLAGGAKWITTPGENGASSSVMLATVECKQVVAPKAKPTCTVKQIKLAASDSKTLMTVLEDANAPSNTPKGVLGVGSRIAKVELTTAQGGEAHFISEGGSVSTTAGKHLADLVTLSQSWADVRDALLAAGGVWKTTNGDHGASSSTMTATVTCSQVVSPTAKPTCTVDVELP